MFFRQLQRVGFQSLFRCCRSQLNLFDQPVAYFSEAQPGHIKLTFQWPFNGGEQTVDAKVGDSLLDVVLDNEIDIDGFGACEGTLACSTCHLILPSSLYDSLPERPSEEEIDLLDIAMAVTDTSRLGCQVIVTEEMDGVTIKIPEGILDTRM